MSNKKFEIKDFQAKPHYFNYDPAEYDFASLIKKIFEFDSELNQLHKKYQLDRLTFENDQNSFLHRKYYDSSQYQEVIKRYQRFVRNEVLPLFKEKSFAVQKEPNFRISMPHNTAIGKKVSEENPIETNKGKEKVGIHSDSMYGHPPGEINFIIGLTPVHGTNGLQFELKPNEGEFKSVEMDYGQFFQFYGNKCRHFNYVNDTEDTRISFDFRVIPMSQYDPNYTSESVHSKRKFLIGDYFEQVDLE